MQNVFLFLGSPFLMPSPAAVFGDPSSTSAAVSSATSAAVLSATSAAVSSATLAAVSFATSAAVSSATSAAVSSVTSAAVSSATSAAVSSVQLLTAPEKEVLLLLFPPLPRRFSLNGGPID